MPNPEDLKDTPSPTSTARAYDAKIVIDEVLGAMSNADKEILEMAEVEEFSGEEIAAAVGITPVALRKRLSRARAEFRKRFLSVTDTGPPQKE
jgi:RNA polymerase sigma factor (sigma-70 family)